MLTNEQKAELELKHIQLELQFGRTHHFRHFIDQYQCYRDGCVTKGGKPRFGIAWDGLVSTEAQKVTVRKKVVKDHVVPLNVITQLLLPLGQTASLHDIKQIIDEYLIFATISELENKRLIDAGLNETMPAEFSNPTDPLFQDKFARYKHRDVNIIVTLK